MSLSYSLLLVNNKDNILLHNVPCQAQRNVRKSLKSNQIDNCRLCSKLLQKNWSFVTLKLYSSSCSAACELCGSMLINFRSLSVSEGSLWTRDHTKRRAVYWHGSRKFVMHGLRPSKMGPMFPFYTINQCVVCVFVRVGRRFTRTTGAIFTLQDFLFKFQIDWCIMNPSNNSIYSLYHFQYICNALCVCVCVSVCVCVYIWQNLLFNNWCLRNVCSQRDSVIIRVNSQILEIRFLTNIGHSLCVLCFF